jgi:uncharacterized protein HemX
MADMANQLENPNGKSDMSTPSPYETAKAQPRLTRLAWIQIGSSLTMLVAAILALVSMRWEQQKRAERSQQLQLQHEQLEAQLRELQQQANELQKKIDQRAHQSGKLSSPASSNSTPAKPAKSEPPQ